MIADRWRVFNIGGSRGITLPKSCQIRETTTMGCGSRLILADTTGRIHEDDLLMFVLECMEPMFWDWWRREREKTVLDNYVSLGRKIVNGN
ncbi:hypothetical protein B1778_00845 [Dehalococcoides mccartyi]|nr:hypothetical protein B1777_00990 [Dehalococcoides mccartyi]AQU06773.1 hypothetical protein B1778_00845 [Dehalococcoides mccartyi]